MKPFVDTVIKKTLTILFIVFLLVIQLNANTNVCSEVADNGNVEITWQDDNQSEVTSYSLFWADDNINFLSLGSFPNTTNNYSFTADNANQKIIFFQLIRKTNSTSDTLNFSTIFASASNAASVGITNIIAQFNYQKSGTITIDRYQNSTWKTLASLPYNTSQTVSYNDTISYPFCESSEILYRVKFSENNSNCFSVSNVTKINNGKDNSDPKDVIFDYITTANYLSTNALYIGWKHPFENDIKEYRIERRSPSENVFLNVGTVYPPTNFFIDSTAAGCDSIYTYAIISIDSCGRKSIGTYLYGDRNNLKLNIAPTNICDNFIDLSWNLYNAFPDALIGFEVYKKEETGNYNKIADLGPSVLNYRDTLGLFSGRYYQYYIKAITSNSAYEIFSCEKQVKYSGLQLPDSVYINYVTINLDNNVEVNFSIFPDSSAKKAILERADLNGNNFVSVANVDLSPFFLTSNFTFIDSTANIYNQAYSYKIKISDSCNINSIYSDNISNSIFLSLSNTDNNNIFLSWNKYNEWEEGVENYKIIRITNNSQIDTISVVDANTTTFNDNIDGTVFLTYCYRIIATQKNNNFNLQKEISVSNTACSLSEPKSYIPNAFRPNGKNRIFRPIIYYADLSNYKLMIFNKWGTLLFKTDNYNEGWDGETENGSAPPDVYSYLIEFKDLNGNIVIRKGLVNLIR